MIFSAWNEYTQVVTNQINKTIYLLHRMAYG